MDALAHREHTSLRREPTNPIRTLVVECFGAHRDGFAVPAVSSSCAPPPCGCALPRSSRVAGVGGQDLRLSPFRVGHPTHGPTAAHAAPGEHEPRASPAPRSVRAVPPGSPYKPPLLLGCRTRRRAPGPEVASSRLRSPALTVIGEPSPTPPRRPAGCRMLRRHRNVRLSAPGIATRTGQGLDPATPVPLMPMTKPPLDAPAIPTTTVPVKLAGPVARTAHFANTPAMVPSTVQVTNPTCSLLCIGLPIVSTRIRLSSIGRALSLCPPREVLLLYR